MNDMSSESWHSDLFKSCHRIAVGIRNSELSAIFFATFENTRGTVIAYQYPPDYVSHTQFREISNAVLPRAELAFRLITVEAFQHYVIGCPQRIEGDQYQRNTLQFNVCLVLKPLPCPILNDVTRWQFWHNQSAGGLRQPIQAAYEALVLKINRYFYALEEECAFVSRCCMQTADGDLTRPLLYLDSIFQQLKADGTCVLDVEKCGSLYLRFSPELCNPNFGRLQIDSDELVAVSNEANLLLTTDEPEAVLIKSRPSCTAWVSKPQHREHQTDQSISDASVFVLVRPCTHRDSRMGPGMAEWQAVDAVSRRLLPFMDGLHCLPEIAELAKVDLAVTRLCVLHLIRRGVIHALPAPTFLYPVPTSVEVEAYPIAMPGWLGLPRLAKLLSDPVLADACMEAAVYNSPAIRSSSGVVADLFHVYAMLCGSPNFNLTHFVAANAHHIQFVDVPATQPTHCSSQLHTLVQSDTNRLVQLYLRRLVQFGECNGLIHRLQCYPLRATKETSHTVDKSPPTSLAPVQPQTAHVNPHSHLLTGQRLPRQTRWSTSDELLWNETVTQLMDGLHSVDEISCAMIPPDLAQQSSFGMTSRCATQMFHLTTVNQIAGSGTVPNQPIVDGNWLTTTPPHGIVGNKADTGVMPISRQSSMVSRGNTMRSTRNSIAAVVPPSWRTPHCPSDLYFLWR